VFVDKRVGISEDLLSGLALLRVTVRPSEAVAEIEVLVDIEMGVALHLSLSWSLVYYY
jgi:hypothetical protein